MDKDQVKNMIKSTNIRYVYTNDIIAFITVITFLGTHIYGVLNGVVIEYHYLTIIIVLATYGWIFGVDLLDKFSNNR
jgi:hypothetical protein